MKSEAVMRLLDHGDEDRAIELEAAGAIPLEQPCVLRLAPPGWTNRIFVDEDCLYLPSRRHPISAHIPKIFQSLGLSANGETNGQIVFGVLRTTGVHVGSFRPGR